MYAEEGRLQAGEGGLAGDQTRENIRKNKKGWQFPLSNLISTQVIYKVNLMHGLEKYGSN